MRFRRDVLPWAKWMIGGFGGAVACAGSEECDGPGGLCLASSASAGKASTAASSGSGGKAQPAGGGAGQPIAMGGTTGGETPSSGATDMGGDTSISFGGDWGSGGTSTGGSPFGSGATAATSGYGGSVTGGGPGKGGGPSTCPYSFPSSECAAQGGAGGDVGAGGAAAGAAGSGDSLGPGWCQGLPVGGKGGTGGATSGDLLLDDFEDGDAYTLPFPDGRGWWQAVNDQTSGGKMYPESCPPLVDGAAEPTYAPGESAQGFWALQTYACGFGPYFGGAWGAAVQVVLRRGAPECTQGFDASAYGGIKFFARGSGNIVLLVDTAATTPVEYGGTCAVDCYNSYITDIALTPDWASIVVPFPMLQQAWGAGAFLTDTQAITSIAWRSQAMSFELWIDDVAFTL